MVSAIETLHPGVYIDEVGGNFQIPLGGTGTGGCLAIFEKGPTNKAMLVTSREQGRAWFGDFYQRSPGPHFIDDFFINGGARLWVSRVVGSGAAKATITLDDLEGADTLTVKASSVGAWGNRLEITTQRWQHKTTASLADGATSVAVDSVRDVQLGDLVVIQDVAAGELGIAYVNSITVATKTIGFQAISNSNSATLAAGSLVQCATSHRRSTTTVGNSLSGAAYVNLTNTRDIFPGARLTLDDGSNAVVSLVVESVSGNQVNLVGTLPNDVDAGAIAATQEFDIQVYDKGRLLERWDFLSMEPTNTRDYVATRLSGDTNDSLNIEVVDESSTPTDGAHRVPDPLGLQLLASGADGSTPGDNEYIGAPQTELVEASGIHVFDTIDDINMLSVPGVTTVAVQRYLVDWCDGRHRTADPVMCILSTPLSDDLPQEAYDFRVHELNVDSHQATLYYPWAEKRDPFENNARIRQSMEGVVQGQWALMSSQYGVHWTPANHEPVRNVAGLTYDVRDGEHDLLNPVGVNVIRTFPGRGTRIFGGRTLWSTIDGRHYIAPRRVMNMVEEDLKDNMQWVVFRPNDPALWKTIEDVIRRYLRVLWLKGMLTPSTDASKAFYVRCNEKTNPAEEIALGRVHAEIGINPPPPAEFAIFRVGLWDGRLQSIEENIIARTAAA